MAPISRAFPAWTQTVAAGTGGDNDCGDFDSDGNADRSNARGVILDDNFSSVDDGATMGAPGDSGVGMDGVDEDPDPDGPDWDDPHARSALWRCMPMREEIRTGGCVVREAQMVRWNCSGTRRARRACPGRGRRLRARGTWLHRKRFSTTFGSDRPLRPYH